MQQTGQASPLFPAPSCSAIRRGRKPALARRHAGCRGSRPRTACSISGWRRSGDMDAARVITDDRKRGIRFHGWMHNGTHVLYLQDENGTEDFHVFAVEVATGQSRNLTPMQGVQAQMHGLSLDFPRSSSPSASTSATSPGTTSIRIDIRTGKRELLFENIATALTHRAGPPAAAAACVPDARERGRPHPLPHRGRQARADRRGRARGPPDHAHPRLHARRQDALRRVIHRPRQGGAVRHRLASGAQRCWRSTPRPTSAQVLTHPETFVIAGGRRDLHLHLDWIPLDEAHRGRPEVPARRAAGRDRHRRPHARRQAVDRHRRAPPRRRRPIISTTRKSGTITRAVRDAAGSQALSAGADAGRDHSCARDGLELPPT